MADKEKQIEEMAKFMAETSHIECGRKPCEECKWCGCERSEEADCTDYLIAEHLYNAGYRKQSEWISVEDRLPTDRELVLVSSMDLFTKKHGWFYLARYTDLQNDGVRFDDKRWLSENGGIFGKVTHWMPLPEAPKMKGGE